VRFRAAKTSVSRSTCACKRARRRPTPKCAPICSIVSATSVLPAAWRQLGPRCSSG
jgi:hypothetical protein